MWSFPRRRTAAGEEGTQINIASSRTFRGEGDWPRRHTTAVVSSSLSGALSARWPCSLYDTIASRTAPWYSLAATTTRPPGVFVVVGDAATLTHLRHHASPAVSQAMHRRPKNRSASESRTTATFCGDRSTPLRRLRVVERLQEQADVDSAGRSGAQPG